MSRYKRIQRVSADLSLSKKKRRFPTIEGQGLVIVNHRGRYCVVQPQDADVLGVTAADAFEKRKASLEQTKKVFETMGLKKTSKPSGVYSGYIWK